MPMLSQLLCSLWADCTREKVRRSHLLPTFWRDKLMPHGRSAEICETSAPMGTAEWRYWIGETMKQKFEASWAAFLITILSNPRGEVRNGKMANCTLTERQDLPALDWTSRYRPQQLFSGRPEKKVGQGKPSYSKTVPFCVRTTWYGVRL